MENSAMRSHIVAAWVTLALGVAVTPAALATKPCPPSPCENGMGQFDRTRCEASADWIAQGTITKVVHHREGPPLAKDFADFTFRIERWEKKADGVGPEIRFKVGWCENRQELPPRTDGLFRVFGLFPSRASPHDPRYLFLEPVNDRVAP
jgi:hypothetical protein